MMKHTALVLPVLGTPTGIPAMVTRSFGAFTRTAG
jgi:hypothetical protein